MGNIKALPPILCCLILILAGCAPSGISTLEKTRAAASESSPNARLCRNYAEGEGVARNYQEAAHWCRLAADEGSALGQYYLALLYHNGQGVTQDYQKSVALLHDAANQGLAAAQKELASMYYLGKGLWKDRFKAAWWYKKAADQDDPEALYMLGVMHLNGSGVYQNKLQAKDYFSRACNRGLEKACGPYRRLAKRFDADPDKPVRSFSGRLSGAR